MRIADRPLYYRGGRELTGLQILKFLCALMVVEIHIPSFGHPYLLPFCRIAVPVFFLISGYFMMDREGFIRKDKIKRIFIKILRLTVFVNVCYLFYRFLSCLRIDDGFDKTFLNYKFWGRIFLTGDGAACQLWYLTAYLQLLIIFYAAIRIKRFSYLYILMIIGISLNLIIGRYGFLFFGDCPVILSRNVLTIALPCVLLGILIRRYEDRLPSNNVIFAGMIISFVLLYLEEYLIRSRFTVVRGDILIFTIPLAIVTFIFFLRLDLKDRYSMSLARWGKEYSLDIFIWHIGISYLILRVLKWIGLTGFDTFIVAIATIVFAMIIKRSGLKSIYA